MPIKLTTTKGGGRKQKKTKSKKIYRTSQNIRIINFFWVTAVRVLSLSGSHSPPHLPSMSSNTVLNSGPAVGAAQSVIWSYSSVFLPPMSTAIRASAFSFVRALNALFIFHRHRVCLVDHVDLIWSLYSWWEGFGSSSLAALPLSFNCGFISTSVCGSSTGVSSWGSPGGLGFAPVRARFGGGAAAWVTGVLAAPGTQGSWQLGHQEIKHPRRVWQPVLTNILQYFCLENTPPWQRSLAAHSLSSAQFNSV